MLGPFFCEPLGSTSARTFDSLIGLLGVQTLFRVFDLCFANMRFLDLT